MVELTYYMPRHRSTRMPRMLRLLMHGRVKTFARLAADKMAIDPPMTLAERHAEIERRNEAIFAHFRQCSTCEVHGLCDNAVKYLDRTRLMEGLSAHV